MFTGDLILAQNEGKVKTSFSVLGGANYQNLTGKDFNGDKLSSTGIIGFHAGVNAQIPIVPPILFSARATFFNKRIENYRW